ncbi:MAG TPA: hypothetical protein VFP58_05505 [Candidatus Eisenbacteria bacterium]|nr:hypothetical protein [Candidatus Eisenbacteria bacterium]
MKHDVAHAGPLRFGGARTSLLVVALLCSVPASAFGENHEPATFVPEFNRICSELTRTRAALGSGMLREEDFAEKVLALFVDADSLQVAFRTAWPGASKAGTPVFALDRGFRYLIESLRENYVGIASQSGWSFVEADRALQAAVAWQSGVGLNLGVNVGGGGTAVLLERVADATRP